RGDGARRPPRHVASGGAQPVRGRRLRGGPPGAVPGDDARPRGRAPGVEPARGAGRARRDLPRDRSPMVSNNRFPQPNTHSHPAIDPLEAELAETMVAVAEAASSLAVRVGIADGKFAAYVAAVLGIEMSGADGHDRE